MDSSNNRQITKILDQRHKVLTMVNLTILTAMVMPTLTTTLQRLEMAMQMDRVQPNMVTLKMRGAQQHQAQEV